LLTKEGFFLSKIFGSGLGFPMRTNDGVINAESNALINPRADSFSLYMNFVAEKMLQNLLPKGKLEGTMH
jgi:hypothetical protein